MKVLITGASGRLTQAIATALGQEHALRLMDSVPVKPPEKVEFIQGSLLNPDDVWRAVRGMEAVILTGEPPPDLPGDGRDRMLLDLATRGTHNLCKAAVEAGVNRLLYAGTLSVFRPYPDDRYINENTKPLPGPEMGEMSRYLGELTCREFARDHLVTVTCLRLGTLALEEEVVGQTPDLMWLDPRDAAQAFRAALNRDHSREASWTRRWAVWHVGAAIPNPKYLTPRALTDLGYKPAHNFQANWTDKTP
ncbi:MAG: NAD(P)-dependent oxidoreductase [Candidatus Latescibacteria bacterium]|nr:NAD(P)-dependent oxidoreductase [Candidatus Latescibacterota bacterium]